MIAFFLSPIGRYAVLALAILFVAAGFYGKIRHDAQAEQRAVAAEDALRRLKNAVNAGDAVPTDPDRVRDPDRNERDE
jgi:serine/threonine protein kinase HipA of HipAB toxin-antitoxin module